MSFSSFYAYVKIPLFANRRFPSATRAAKARSAQSIQGLFAVLSGFSTVLPWLAPRQNAHCSLLENFRQRGIRQVKRFGYSLVSHFAADDIDPCRQAGIVKHGLTIAFIGNSEGIGYCRVSQGQR